MQVEMTHKKSKQPVMVHVNSVEKMKADGWKTKEQPKQKEVNKDG